MLTWTTNSGVMMLASGAMAGMSRGVAGLPARGAHHGTATHHHGLPASGARSTATRGSMFTANGRHGKNNGISRRLKNGSGTSRAKIDLMVAPLWV